MFEISDSYKKYLFWYQPSVYYSLVAYTWYQMVTYVWENTILLAEVPVYTRYNIKTLMHLTNKCQKSKSVLKTLVLIENLHQLSQMVNVMLNYLIKDTSSGIFGEKKRDTKSFLTIVDNIIFSLVVGQKDRSVGGQTSHLDDGKSLLTANSTLSRTYTL